MAKQLGDSFKIRNTVVSNRICLPPMVMFGYSDGSGVPTDKNIEHYRRIAQGGAGLIIQEATCINPDGRLSDNQLGIWSDAQIVGHAAIARAVHEAGRPIVMQLHHAGVVGIAPAPQCPSDYTLRQARYVKHGHAMSDAEIAAAISDFIAAARRACAAGYDGVELHGCHSYLISQFMNRRVNRRTDKYGAPEALVGEIIDGIRAWAPADFIVGIRLGCFEPTLADGMAHARTIERQGFDFIDASYGFDGESSPQCPADWPYKDIVYAAGALKKCVGIPVFAVNGINTPAEARDILARTDVDMVDIGRATLVDPDWANKALSGAQPGKCLHCPRCAYAYCRLPAVCPGPAKCAGRLLLKRQAARA